MRKRKQGQKIIKKGKISPPPYLSKKKGKDIWKKIKKKIMKQEKEGNQKSIHKKT
ncbi:hypothetical protein IG9_05762 [Bacillus cereus HuA2-9]|nr:hypothetical protein IG9_05762 [Bacillus cereus HuA2-9]